MHIVYRIKVFLAFKVIAKLKYLSLSFKVTGTLGRGQTTLRDRHVADIRMHSYKENTFTCTCTCL